MEIIERLPVDGFLRVALVFGGSFESFRLNCGRLDKPMVGFEPPGLEVQNSQDHGGGYRQPAATTKLPAIDSKWFFTIGSKARETEQRRRFSAMTKICHEKSCLE